MQKKRFYSRKSFWTCVAAALGSVVLALAALPATAVFADSGPGKSPTVFVANLPYAQAPTNITLSSNSIAENQPVNTSVGTLESTDPDPDDSSTYNLVTDAIACPEAVDNASFNISADTLRASASFNFEVKDGYSICIRATDQGGLSLTRPFTIRIDDVNDRPVAQAMIFAGAAGMTIPMTLLGSDEDGDPLTFSIVSGPVHGSLTGTPPNVSYISVPCFAGMDSFTFLANDGYLDSNPADVTITFTETTSPPTDITLSSISVDEHQPAGTLVGNFSPIDPNACAGDFVYSFCGGPDDGSFRIEGDALKTAAVFIYERKNSYSICVRYTDSGALYTNTQPFTISVNNLGIDELLVFADVPVTYWASPYIEAIYAARITGGCGTNPLVYCPTSPVTRAQMAVFLLKGIHGSSYAPPAATGTRFTDVPASYWASAWIEQLAADGITGGCGTGIYCPENSVTRDQMAVFLLKARHGTSFVPPTAIGSVFADVPDGYWAAAWIEQLAAEGITGGCGAGIYCPSSPVTRDQMAVFLQRVFSLPMP